MMGISFWYSSIVDASCWLVCSSAGVFLGVFLADFDFLDGLTDLLPPCIFLEDAALLRDVPDFLLRVVLSDFADLLDMSTVLDTPGLISDESDWFIIVETVDCVNHVSSTLVLCIVDIPGISIVMV